MSSTVRYKVAIISIAICSMILHSLASIIVYSMRECTTSKIINVVSSYGPPIYYASIVLFTLSMIVFYLWCEQGCVESSIIGASDARLTKTHHHKELIFVLFFVFVLSDISTLTSNIAVFTAQSGDVYMPMYYIMKEPVKLFLTNLSCLSVFYSVVYYVGAFALGWLRLTAIIICTIFFESFRLVIWIFVGYITNVIHGVNINSDWDFVFVIVLFTSSLLLAVLFKREVDRWLSQRL